MKSKMEEILKYVEKVWTGANARFPIALWSRYDIQGPRTNNHVEGWHSGLNKSVANAHPDIYKFIALIKKEQKKNELKVSFSKCSNCSYQKYQLLQVETGGKVAHVSKKYRDMEAKVQAAILSYSGREDENAVVDFLDEVSGFLHLG